MIAMLLLLTACAVGGESRAESSVLEIRARVLAAQRLTAVVDVTADYGERVYEYGLTFTGDANSGELEVVTPQEIAGARATVSVSGGTLSYDGATLDTGAITRGGLSPVEAVPALIEAWCVGDIMLSGFEKYGETEAVMMVSALSPTVTQTTWFDRETGLPVCGELMEDERVVIRCEFDSVVME